jgi:hypothetical protein
MEKPFPGEQRRVTRRSGIGRRIHGERRTIPLLAKQNTPDYDRRARSRERRVQKRRILPDRRSR